jgi:hypothetical protein
MSIRGKICWQRGIEMNQRIPIVDAVLAVFIANTEPYVICSSLDLRALAAELQILPVWLDMGGCYGLRLDGTVVSFTWDEPHQIRVEPDERIRNLALFQGSVKYPELRCLVPQRPASGVTCPHCAGSAKVYFDPKDLSKTFVCFCGGLGWLPSETDSPSLGVKEKT